MEFIIVFLLIALIISYLCMFVFYRYILNLKDDIKILQNCYDRLDYIIKGENYE